MFILSNVWNSTTILGENPWHFFPRRTFKLHTCSSILRLWKSKNFRNYEKVLLQLPRRETPRRLSATSGLGASSPETTVSISRAQSYLTLSTCRGVREASSPRAYSRCENGARKKPQGNTLSAAQRSCWERGGRLGCQGSAEEARALDRVNWPRWTGTRVGASPGCRAAPPKSDPCPLTCVKRKSHRRARRLERGGNNIAAPLPALLIRWN